MTTVAIIDDQPVHRAGMENVILADSAFQVVAAVDEPTALPSSRPNSYDVIVLHLPARTMRPTPEVIQELATIGPTLICSTWNQPPSLLAAIQAGARACITRYTPAPAIMDALRVVLGGGFYLCPQLADRFHADLNRPPADNDGGLAPREIETLRGIALGLTHGQIASRMGVSQATVNTYVKRIRAKLNVRNKAELTRMAIELGHLTARVPPPS